MPRALSLPWIDSYVRHVQQFTDNPTEFNIWAAAVAVAATLKRNSWIDRGNWKLYPNIFTILVGRPATGKGAAINPIVDILKDAKTVNLLSDRLTIEYVLEKLSKGNVNPTLVNGQVKLSTDSTALIVAPELSVFLRTSSDALGDLCQIWDNKSFDYGTRHKGLYEIKNPGVSLLGGSAPAWLAKSIPNDAVGGGFTRRVNFVYTKSDPKMPTWDTGNVPDPLVYKQSYDGLVADLKHISSTIHGPFAVSPEFILAFDNYTKGIKIEDFDDEATVGFKASKWVNVIKLSMAFCASRTDDMIITDQDFLLAAGFIDRVETDLNLVFRAVGESDDVSASAKILEFVEKRGSATLPQIMRSLWRHVTRDDALRILAAFTEAGMIHESTRNHTNVYTFNINTTP